LAKVIEKGNKLFTNSINWILASTLVKNSNVRNPTWQTLAIFWKTFERQLQVEGLEVGWTLMQNSNVYQDNESSFCNISFLLSFLGFVDKFLDLSKFMLKSPYVS
jgi:hypothetical protein